MNAIDIARRWDELADAAEPIYEADKAGETVVGCDNSSCPLCQLELRGFASPAAAGAAAGALRELWVTHGHAIKECRPHLYTACERLAALMALEPETP